MDIAGLFSLAGRRALVTGASGVLGAQLQDRRHRGRRVEPLAVEIALDPPVGIVGVAEVQGLAVAGESAELAALGRLPDLTFDP